MKAFDRFIRGRRLDQALPYVRPDSRVLDIGCFDDSLFAALGERLRDGVGIDPLIAATRRGPRWEIRPGRLPGGAPGLAGPFDAVTLLAVLEHVPDADLAPLAAEIAGLLAPRGRLVITVPSPAVDAILAVLKGLRLIDGMSLEEHHDFDPAATRRLFEEAGLTLLVHCRFQLGLNNLFVFEKPPRS